MAITKSFNFCEKIFVSEVFRAHEMRKTRLVGVIMIDMLPNEKSIAVAGVPVKGLAHGR